MLFKGTVVARGSGAGVVVATGMHTELGTISKMVEETEEPTTPLERRLARLAHGLMALTLVIAALIGTGALYSGSSPLLVIQTSIALAVATVPEGLPIIATITLARGMLRLVGHQALVQRLAAIETLGSTSILCTDKTGTLTENRLRVQDILPHEGIPEARHRCLEVGLLCNNASLPHDGEPAVGDPLEVALLAAARDAGIEREGLLARWPRVREVAFDAESRRMVTVHGHAAPHRLAVKGAPEAILDACDLDAASRSEWAQRAEAMATRGLRVLGMAEARRDDPEASAENLQLLGLVGMWDPPSPSAPSTVRAFRTAGVQVVMVTGDHPATARHVATAVDLPNAETVWLGRDLESARSAPLERQEDLRKGCVFARVSPKQKLELIALHQSSGAVVAMTGDGVNDAPALKRADIGVAMGGRGSEAAREASDMVLRDDNLATIVTAIGEGRTIFANIRGFAVYLLSCNLSEVLVVSLAVASGGPLPLLPLQILFLNLVTDVFPALALGMGQGAPDRLRRPPRDPKEAVLARRHWFTIGVYGLLLAGAVLAAFGLALGALDLDARGAVTVSFLTLATSQLVHVFNMRRRTSGMLVNEITRNPWVWGALGLCVAILAAAAAIPAAARLLTLERLSPTAWLVVLSLSFAPVVVIQTADAFRRAWRWLRRRPAAGSGSPSERT
jgi:Ca2+-transporting ATPase